MITVARTKPAGPTVVVDDGGVYSVPLQGGSNTITVTVDSTSGSTMTSTTGSTMTSTTYTVTVFRAHSATALTSLRLDRQDGSTATTLKPLKGSVAMYEADVDREIAQVTVIPQPTSAVVSPADADPEMAGHQVDLMASGLDTAITINVTSSGVTTPYTLTVSRAASSDAMLSALSLSGLMLEPGFDAGTPVYAAEAAHDVASTTVSATAMHEGATVSGDVGEQSLAEGANTFAVMVTAEDGSTMTYTVVVNRVAAPVVETVTETVTVPGPTRTKTVTETVIVEVPAAPAAAGVIGSSGSATATEVNGQVMITRHDGGASLVVNVGGFIRDESLGQTYQVVRRMDGMIVRQWVSPNSPLVYQIPWAVVNSQFSVPVGVIGAIPLDDQSGAAGQLVRRFDGGDDRIFSYDGMGGWRHVPDIPTFQALGLYWCDVTAADAGFFDRITIGSPHAATDMPARSDYPSCSTG